MKISVLMPAYNVARTIRPALESALCQSQPPDEILVMNDGSTDETSSILEEYRTRVTVLWQPNGGLASVRNALCSRAKGDLITFLDTDDVWHPRYLEKQCQLFKAYPHAAALFTAHQVIHGDDACSWNADVVNDGTTELITAEKFIRRFAKEPGFFPPSFWCMPRRVLDTMGIEPFKSYADDVYFLYRSSALGPIVYNSTCLGAYRVHDGTLSSNVLKIEEGTLQAMELAARDMADTSPARICEALREVLDLKRRSYAKVLLGAGKLAEAREQLSKTLNGCSGSALKSIALLLLTYTPPQLQPTWPSSQRQSLRPWRWWRWKANR